ncbi:DUF2812 domain-containing protein [Roseburia hominis]
MKDTKTEFRFFTVPEWKKEEEYLRQRHKSGWKFVRVTFPGMYHFEKCEPEDVIYQLDYNQEGLAHKEEYVQMFRDCGWEYLQDFVGYSYFKKSALEMNGEEEIFCDDASRLDMMKRVIKGRMLPLLIMFFLVILPNIYIQSRIDSPINHVLTCVFIGLLVAYLTLFGWIGYHYWKYRNSLLH